MRLHCLTFLRGFQRSAFELQAAASSKATSAEPGAKSKLYSILDQSAVPLNSDQIWQQAEAAGLKSKRHVKSLLSAMRKAGAVQTKPLGKGQNFVYSLRDLPAKARAHAVGEPVQPSSANA